MALPFFATVPRGMESLLAGELRSLGAEHVKQARAGVSLSVESAPSRQKAASPIGVSMES